MTRRRRYTALIGLLATGTGLAAARALAVPDAATTEANRNSACRVDNATTLSRTYTRIRPSWFARPVPGTDPLQVGFIGVDNGNGNYMMNLGTGEATKIPGGVDPVATPDGRYMTVPSGGMGLYDLHHPPGTSTARLSADSPPLKGGPDTDMSDVYQSVGITSGKGSSTKTTYRIATAGGSSNGSAQIRDYEVDHVTHAVHPVLGADGQPKPPATVCGNLSGVNSLSLPMISKDGGKFAALDNNENPPVTKIWNIDAGGNCSNPINLGVATSKVDFSFTGNKITFAMRNNPSQENGWPGVPSDNMLSNIYVLDLDKQPVTAKRITNNRDSSSFYPSFLPDGKVVYTDHPVGANSGEGSNSSFVVADPSKANEGNWALMTGQCADEANNNKFTAAAMLGSLWTHICARISGNLGRPGDFDTGRDIEASRAALVTLNLDPDRCRKMVDDFWSSYRSEVTGNTFNPDYDNRVALRRSGGISISNLDLVKMNGDDMITADDLKAACPTRSAGPASIVRTVGDVGTTRPPLQPIPASSLAGVVASATPTGCENCHLNPRVPFNDPVALANFPAEGGGYWVDRALCRMNARGTSSAMPKPLKTFGGPDARDYYLNPTDTPPYTSDNRLTAKAQAFKDYLETVVRRSGRDPSAITNGSACQPSH